MPEDSGYAPGGYRPAMIEASGITGQQKKRLLAHFHAHPLVASLARRDQARGGAALEEAQGTLAWLKTGDVVIAPSVPCHCLAIPIPN
jgi:hypothetical protein